MPKRRRYSRKRRTKRRRKYGPKRKRYQKRVSIYRYARPSISGGITVAFRNFDTLSLTSTWSSLANQTWTAANDCDGFKIYQRIFQFYRIKKVIIKAFPWMATGPQSVITEITDAETTGTHTATTSTVDASVNVEIDTATLGTNLATSTPAGQIPLAFFTMNRDGSESAPASKANAFKNPLCRMKRLDKTRKWAYKPNTVAYEQNQASIEGLFGASSSESYGERTINFNKWYRTENSDVKYYGHHMNHYVPAMQSSTTLSLDVLYTIIVEFKDMSAFAEAATAGAGEGSSEPVPDDA